MAMPHKDYPAPSTGFGDSARSMLGGEYAKQVRKPTAIDNACETLGAANALASRVMELVNDLIGPVPETCDSECGNYGGPGVLTALARCAEDTNSAIRKANEAIDRLRNAI